MPSTVDRPRPGALAEFLGREERIENPLQVAGRDAAAGVGDLKHDIRPRPAGRMQHVDNARPP